MSYFCLRECGMWYGIDVWKEYKELKRAFPQTTQLANLHDSVPPWSPCLQQSEVASSIISVSVVARAVARGGGIHNIGTELLLGGLLLLTVTISHFTDVIFVWMKKIHNSCRDVKTRSKISVSICDSHRTATNPAQAASASKSVGGGKKCRKCGLKCWTVCCWAPAPHHPHPVAELRSSISWDNHNNSPTHVYIMSPRCSPPPHHL